GSRRRAGLLGRGLRAARIAPRKHVLGDLLLQCGVDALDLVGGGAHAAPTRTVTTGSAPAAEASASRAGVDPICTGLVTRPSGSSRTVPGAPRTRNASNTASSGSPMTSGRPKALAFSRA